MMLLKRETIAAILSDPEWAKKLEAAETWKQVFKVVEDYCKEKKLKVKYVPIS